MKVGDYVRYKRPFDIKETIMIGKIIRIYEPNKQSKIKGYDLDTADVISDEFSIKSSPNIIDLIEVGDYVNEIRVTNISKEQGKNIEIYLDTDDLFEQTIYKNENIKSIVTHEQFSQMEYRIGE